MPKSIALLGPEYLKFFHSVLFLLRHSVSFGFFKIPVLESVFLPRLSAILLIALPAATGTLAKHVAYLYSNITAGGLIIKSQSTSNIKRSSKGPYLFL